ncbi:MAG: hypothetical protein U1F59_13235 [Candidatus Competibacteraceae bacterium]
MANSMIDGLFIETWSHVPEYVQVDFYFYDSNSPVISPPGRKTFRRPTAIFRYRSYQDHTPSMLHFPDEIESTPIFAPTVLRGIPDKVDDAVLQTVQNAPWTWANTNHIIKLTLSGIVTHVWTFNVQFPVALHAQRLDGVWRRFI